MLSLFGVSTGHMVAVFEAAHAQSEVTVVSILILISGYFHYLWHTLPLQIALSLPSIGRTLLFSHLWVAWSHVFRL